MKCRKCNQELPEPAFPMGAKVRDIRDGNEMTVTGWTADGDGTWVVEGKNGDPWALWRRPEYLELVPDEPELPNEEEPRNCAVCGEPVRLTGDGHPYHYSARADIGDHHATLTAPTIEVCVLCGHGQESIGGSADGRFLCHGCDEDHDCYRRWTVHGVRPHTDYCRDLLCGGCEEVVDDVPHHDDCECGDCVCTQNPYQHADPCDDPCGGCQR